MKSNILNEWKKVERYGISYHETFFDFDQCLGKTIIMILVRVSRRQSREMLKSQRNVEQLNIAPSMEEKNTYAICIVVVRCTCSIGTHDIVLRLYNKHIYTIRYCILLYYIVSAHKLQRRRRRQRRRRWLHSVYKLKSNLKHT